MNLCSMFYLAPILSYELMFNVLAHQNLEEEDDESGLEDGGSVDRGSSGQRWNVEASNCSAEILKNHLDAYNRFTVNESKLFLNGFDVYNNELK